MAPGEEYVSMKPAEVCGSKPSSVNADSKECILSPRFRSAAAMAGWDEESLLAGLVVQDTPDPEPKRKRRFSRTPTTDSSRKRRSQRRSTAAIPVVVLSLDEEEATNGGCEGVDEKKREGAEVVVVDDGIEGSKVEGCRAGSSENASCRAPDGKEEEEAVVVGGGGTEEPKADSCRARPGESSSSAAALPCIDRLREELSCAICLDICFEPSTTPCGHSFCKKCLKCAATRCGKRCPKCRELISNARSCTVNTVLWNTIQLLFPEEVEARRKATSSSRTPEQKSSGHKRTNSSNPTTENTLRRSPRRTSAFILSSELVREAEISRSTGSIANATQVPRPVEGGGRGRSSIAGGRRRARPSQSEDAALALRLQREEFLGAVTGAREQQQYHRSSVHSARDNLRAIASRAITQLRTRTRLS